MRYNIKKFESTLDEPTFVKDQVIVHFDWNNLLKELQNKSPFPHVLIAADGRKTIGMILLNSNISDEIDSLNVSPSGSIWIYRLYVDKKHRNKGVGSNLVKSAEEYAAENGQEELWLDTIQAGKYYEEKFGYQYVASAPYKDQMTRIYKKELCV